MAPAPFPYWLYYLDIDIISTSSIHQGVPHVDFSLKIDHWCAKETKAKKDGNLNSLNIYSNKLESFILAGNSTSKDTESPDPSYLKDISHDYIGSRKEFYYSAPEQVVFWMAIA